MFNTLTFTYNKELYDLFVLDKLLTVSITYNYYHPSIPHYLVVQANKESTLRKLAKQHSIGSHSMS